MKVSSGFAKTRWTITICLLCVLCLSTLPFGSNRPVSWIILSVAVLLIFAAQIAIDIRQKLPRHTRTLFFPALLYFGAVLWAVIQTLPGVTNAFAHPVWSAVDATPSISADPGQGQHGVMRLISYAMIFWITLRCAASSARARFLLKGFAIFSTALAVFGIYAATTGQNPFLGAGEQNRAVTASFVNRNSYATYAIFGVLANIAAYLHIVGTARRDPERWANQLRDVLERFFSGAWIFALGVLLCLTALGLTQSRAGGVSALIGIAVFATAWQKRRRHGYWLLGALVLAVGFVLLTSATDLTTRLFTTDIENARFLIYPRIIDGIMDRPLLGHGLGAFQDTFRAYVPAEAALGEWVRGHNSFLENAFEFGLPAAAAFYAALGLIVWQIRKATRHRRRNRAFSCFAYASVAAAATHSLFDFSLQIPAVAAAFAMILALGWSQSHSRSRR